MALPDLLALLKSRHGHFLLESGNHGDRWLDVDRLFDDPALAVPFARELAERLRPYDIEAVCGPASGGGILAGLVARELGVGVAVAQRSAGPGSVVTYRLSDEQACVVAANRVAVVDDVIGAGSAVIATLADVRRLDGTVVVIGALLESGLAPGRMAEKTGMPVVSLGRLESGMWAPADCPLCQAKVPLEVLVPMA
jgi:orotate phosphoribosyltransferase